MSEHDLGRFEEALDIHFDRALGELETGRKVSHWMWFAFPQLAGLGISETSRQYAIRDLDEATAFLTHAGLGPCYLRLVDAVWRQVAAGRTLGRLFGRPDDAKLVSSLTLFAGMARRMPPDPVRARFVEQAGDILDAAREEGLPPCELTERFLATGLLP